MCGHVGVAGDVDLKEKKQFKGFLDACQVRGRDSTGVIKVQRDQKDYTWVKRVGPPSFLFDTKEYDRQIDNGGVCAALIGHCRHKTSGDVSNATAHPFDFPKEGIVGAHNGTLRSYYDLDGYHHSRVDSEVLYEHLAKNGPEDTFPKISGAWCCVWWDQNNQTLNFIRNDERPLFFCWSKDFKKLYWASETWMFGAIEREGERQGTELWEGSETTPKYIELPVNQLWSFKMNMANANNKEKPIFTLLPPKLIEGKKYVPTYTQGARSNSGNASKTGGVKSSASSEGFYNGRLHYDGWEYDPKEDRWTRTDGTEGGEGKPPFRPSQQTVGNTRGGKTNSTGRVLVSTTSSSNSSDQSTASTCSQKDGKNVESQRPKLSLISQRTSKSEPSDDLTNSISGFGVSLRDIRGMMFITNNRNSKEYSEEEFDKNTGGKCCFCKDPIGDLSEVDTILDDTSFICKHCVTPDPKKAVA